VGAWQAHLDLFETLAFLDPLAFGADAAGVDETSRERSACCVMEVVSAGMSPG
jgi:hypothetical protein